MNIKTTPVLLLMMLSNIAVSAPENSPSVDEAVVSKSNGLSPDQLNAIKLISRSVISAKKSQSEDQEDVEKLSQLKAAIDLAITAEMSAVDEGAATESETANPQARRKANKAAESRNNAKSRLENISYSLRQPRAMKVLPSNTNNGEAADVNEVTGRQREVLFERWATAVDDALNEQGNERVVKLINLRNKLNPETGKIIEHKKIPRTPTLQAMPAGYIANNQNKFDEE